jgi:hypothetical protein
MPLAILILALMTIIGLSSSTAEAGTKIPGVAPQKKWKGCNPPASMRPAPKYHCGQAVTNIDAGEPRKVEIELLEAAPIKGGLWLWTYYMTDGTFAHADSLRE